VTLGPLKIGESASLFRKFLYVWLASNAHGLQALYRDPKFRASPG